MIKNYPVIPHIIEQHAEEAAFLWLLRHNAVYAPHYNLKDLAKLDNRVDAHIDGLRVAGDYGWEVCCSNLEHKEPGKSLRPPFWPWKGIILIGSTQFIKSPKKLPRL